MALATKLEAIPSQTRRLGADTRRWEPSGAVSLRVWAVWTKEETTPAGAGNQSGWSNPKLLNPFFSVLHLADQVLEEATGCFSSSVTISPAYYRWKIKTCWGGGGGAARLRPGQCVWRLRLHAGT